jgi:hypothetical protein
MRRLPSRFQPPLLSPVAQNALDFIWTPSPSAPISRVLCSGAAGQARQDTTERNTQEPRHRKLTRPNPSVAVLFPTGLREGRPIWTVPADRQTGAGDYRRSGR